MDSNPTDSLIHVSESVTYCIVTTQRVSSRSFAARMRQLQQLFAHHTILAVSVVLMVYFTYLFI